MIQGRFIVSEIGPEIILPLSRLRASQLFAETDLLKRPRPALFEGQTFPRLIDLRHGQNKRVSSGFVYRMTSALLAVRAFVQTSWRT
jgi:hypothetical protein